MEEEKSQKKESIPAFQFLIKHQERLKEVAVGIAAFFAVFIMTFAAHEYRAWQSFPNNAIKISEPSFSNLEKEEDAVETPDPPQISIDDWQEYKNQYYGFFLKYPAGWEKPATQAAAKNSKWQYRYLFRGNFSENQENPFAGFDVLIYDVRKIKEVAGTDEFPKLKNPGAEPSEECQSIEGHLYENPDYPAEEIYIQPDDECYETDFFYSLTRDEYIYNFVPAMKEGAIKSENPKKHVIENFPEFFGIASSIDLIDIVRPKPVPPKPKITAPKPVSYKKVNGKLVCAKKNDKPGKSTHGNKRGHLDMECCLDPDEVPNPWCYYDPAKYGKYL